MSNERIMNSVNYASYCVNKAQRETLLVLGKTKTYTITHMT